MKLKELSEQAYYEQIDLADIRKHINPLPDADQALVNSAVQFAEATFKRQQNSLADFELLTRNEKIDYYAAVCGVRERYHKDGNYANVIGFHFLLHQLQRSIINQT